MSSRTETAPGKEMIVSVNSGAPMFLTSAVEGEQKRLIYSGLRPANQFSGGSPAARPMTARELVSLFEEMVDLKIQQFAESTMRPNPEIAKILQVKRETDRRRLEQIKAELIRILE